MNIKPDLIAVWAKNNDFPMWRDFIDNNMARFRKVFVVIMEPNQGFDYSEFFTKELEAIGVTVLKSPLLKPGEDWRDVAIKEALKHSKSSWIWFTEQDFFPKKGFFDEVGSFQKMGCQVVSAYQENRMHPCSIFIRREILDSLKKLDFGIVPDQLDHFGMIQKQLESRVIAIGKLNPKFYFHFNGFSHNWKLISLGGFAIYEEDKFISHLKKCLKAPINIHPEFVKVAKKAINSYTDKSK